MLSCGALSWKSRKQTCVVHSTAEAEYVALENAAQEVIWMKQLMVVYEDNQAAICIAQNPQII